MSDPEAVLAKLRDGSIIRKTPDDDEKAWNQMIEFVWPNTDPTEVDLVDYFTFLICNCRLPRRSMYTHLLLVDGAFRRRKGKKLRAAFPRIMSFTRLFREYCRIAYVEYNYFTPEQIDLFLASSSDAGDVPKGLNLLMRCYAVLGYYGQMNPFDFLGIMHEDIAMKKSGFTFPSGFRKDKRFHVPFHRDPSLCRGQHVREYLDFYKECLSDGKYAKGPLFRAVNDDGTLSRMEASLGFLYSVETNIAKALKLPDPETYSGHGFAGPIGGKHPASFSPALQARYNWVEALEVKKDATTEKKRNVITSYEEMLANAHKLLCPDDHVHGGLEH